MHVEDYVFPTV